MMNQVQRLKAVGALTALLMALSLIFSMSANASTGEACNAIGECFTAEEYEQMFGVDNLVATGAFTDLIDNGDGTVSAVASLTGVRVTFQTDPLSRPVAATPTLEPDAPTVGKVLFNLPSPATATRKAALV